MKRLIIIPTCLMLLCSCLSHKASTDYTRHQTGDTAEQSSQTVAEVHTKEYDIDSLFTAMVQRIASLRENQEQESEQVNEKISTYTDSLGYNVREENRTIQRTLSRQSKEQQQRWEEQVEMISRKQFKDIDSMLHEMENRLNIHWIDSTRKIQASEKEPAKTASLSIINVTLILFLLLILLVLIFGKRLKTVFSS